VLFFTAGVGAMTMVGCSKNVELAVENDCAISIRAVVMYHAFHDSDILDVDTILLFPGESGEFEVDIFYDEGYLWVKPDGGNWGFEQSFVIDESAEEPQRIILSGESCTAIESHTEILPDPSPEPSTSSIG
jgi:hypothetical protein